MNEEQLTRILRDAPVPENPMSAKQLIQQGSRQTNMGPPLRAIAALVLLGGALAIGLTTGGDSLSSDEQHLHPRGVGEAVELGFSFAVEARSGLLEQAERVSLDEQVIFIARSSRPGYLCIDEETSDGTWERVFPSAGDKAWKIDAGEHHIQRDGKVQAFVTEFGTGLRRYRLTHDAQSPECSEAKSYRITELLWTAP